MFSRCTHLSAVGLLAAVVVLAGCTSGGSGTAAQSSSSSSSSGTGSPSTSGSAGTTAGTQLPFLPAAQSATAEAARGSHGTVTDIRTGRQDGFDRVVFDVGGTDKPGWNVGYVDAASSQGSGQAIGLDASAILRVALTGMGIPPDTGIPEYSGANPLPGKETAVVTEVYFDHTFEGTTVAFIGSTAQVPFRVFLLDNPTRVVVDLQDHPGG